MATNSIEVRESQDAFENALAIGRFILTPPQNGFSEHNFVGNFMYMYSNEITDFFKHIDTREYVEVERNA